MKLLTAVALVSALGIGTTVSAATVSETKTHTTRGADMNFSFSGLSASDGSDGTLTLVGVNMDYRTSSNEFFDLQIDGAGYGRYACVGSGASGATIIPGSVQGNGSNCNFTLGITIAGADLTGFLADGTVDINLLNATGIDPNSAGATVTATLSYTDAVSAVPLPASSLLLIGGIGGLLAMRRRKKA